MLDHLVRPGVDKFYARPVVKLASSISANTITLLSSLLIFAIVATIAYGMFSWALALILLNRFLDGLDGSVARFRGEVSDFGGYLDIVADFLFYASVPVAFALYDPQANALASVLLLASFIGTASSFLSYAILAEKRGAETTVRGKKSFYHLGGLIEGTESIVFLIIACLFAEYYAVLAYGFAALCGLSTLGRVLQAYQDFSRVRVAEHDE